ncbi:hypothetical protein N9R43_01855 [bacterium]|nr:hypothetical protein [bacterium]
MKSFKEFLTESTNEHKMTLRFAFELEESDVDRIERFLGKYDLRTISKVSTTPITKNPLFFSEIENTKVSKVDIMTGYPMSADVLRQQLADLLELNVMHIAVHPEGWEPKEEVEEDGDKKALLDTLSYGDASDDGKHYGRTFIDNFLQSLSKREDHAKVEVENALSPKATRDQAADVMSTEETASDSVISGDEK